MSARIWGSVLIVALALAAGWFAYDRWRAASTPPTVPAALPQGEPATGGTGAGTGTAAATDVEAETRHPLPPAGADPQPTVAGLREAMFGLADRKAIESSFYADDPVRRAVATVDSLPSESVAMQVRAFRPVPGAFVATATDGDEFVLDERNHRRYAPIVKMLESLDARRATDVFVRFYPLFQSEYRRLGYPNRYFNDRLVAAIDDLLTAPEVRGPVRLVQPKVVYRFADPRLESLSAGQKMMIRMGPDNAVRVKAKLREIRRELVARSAVGSQATAGAGTR